MSGRWQALGNVLVGTVLLAFGPVEVSADPLEAAGDELLTQSGLEPPFADAGTPGMSAFAPMASDPRDPPVPAVAVRVRVPASAVAGRDLEYRLIVENVSRAAAHHVVLRIPVPVHTRFVRARPEPTRQEPELQWRLGSLPAGVRREVTLTVAPTGAGDVQCCARVQFEHGQCVRTRLSRSMPPAPPETAPTSPPPRTAEPPRTTEPPRADPARAELRLRKNGPARALRYDALTYRVDVTNTGGVEATGVVLVDTLPDGLEFSTSTPSTAGDNPLTWKLGSIPPGATRRVEYQVFAKKAGDLTNRAEVTAAGGLRQQASQTVIVGEARLQATITGPTRRIVNRPATYQISVLNAGSMPVSGLRVVKEIPTDIIFVSASDGGQVAGNQLTWNLGTLPAGGRRVVSLTLRARKAGELINRVQVTADRGLSVQAEARTTFDTATGLTVEVEKSDDPLELGRPATYTVRVLNQGSAAATNLGVSVAAPDQVKVTAARGPVGVNAQQAGNRVTFAALPTLAPGAEASYTVSVQAVRPGEARLRVEVTADQLAPGMPLKQEESTTVIGEPMMPPASP